VQAAQAQKFSRLRPRASAQRYPNRSTYHDPAQGYAAQPSASGVTSVLEKLSRSTYAAEFRALFGIQDVITFLNTLTDGYQP
jgi:hypothetical protein